MIHIPFPKHPTYKMTPERSRLLAVCVNHDFVFTHEESSGEIARRMMKIRPNLFANFRQKFQYDDEDIARKFGIFKAVT